MIRVEHLQKYYNKGKKNEQHVLRDVNLELSETGLVCILGESGSGKTTLLNTIGGLDTFSGGSITINDTSVTRYDPAKIEPIRNDHFGYIFQNYYLLQDHTVAYNVKLALNRYDLTEEEKDQRTEYVLGMLGMAKYKKKQVSKLSGGQQQRVSIARALVKSPDIIMADEPTGNLDEENTLRTMSILKAISKTCLVLLVTHEKRIARFFADRIIEVRDGKIVRDEKNESQDIYERVDDANIYLKEMDCAHLQSNYAEFRLYYNKQFEPSPVKLNLAWRDGKLYIQNLMDCDILLEGAANGVQMLDAQRPKLEMEDVDQFVYELPKLKGDKSAALSRREIWKMAVQNIRLMGKKQAFVIAILLVTAVLLSITMAQFVNTISVDENTFVATDSHYIRLDFTKVSAVRDVNQREKIFEFTNKYLADGSIGEVFFAPDVNIYLMGEGFVQMKDLKQEIKQYCFADAAWLTEEQLIAGSLPARRDEIVVDQRLLQSLMDSKGVISSAYNQPQDFIGTRFYVSSAGQFLTIVGVSDTQEPDIYCRQNVLLTMGNKVYEIESVEELQAEKPKQFDRMTLADNEILVRESLLRALATGSEKNKETYRIGGEMHLGDDVEHKYIIKGTVPDDVSVDYILSDEGCDNVKNLCIYDNKNCIVYSTDMKQTKDTLQKAGEDYMTAFRLDISVPRVEEIKAYKQAHTIDLDAKGFITGVIVVISLIMVYFTMKSNAVSRSEELTVYRLIGISKGSIQKAYMLEMFLMTCYTSLPAVLITSGVIKLIGSVPSLEMKMLFPWWSVLILLVAIYVIHMMISILPVSGILGKPPASLAVKE